MDTAIVLLMLIALIGIATGVVMLIVNYAKDRSKKRSFIVIASSVFALVVLIGALNMYENHLDKLAAQEEAANVSAFKKAADQYTANYEVTGYAATSLASDEHDEWGDDIDNSSYDSYDPSDTVTEIVENHEDDISTLTTELNKEQKLLDTMSQHKNKKYNYSYYKKSYTALKDLADFVSSPYGSYADFADTVNGYQDTASNYADEMSDNN
jgi:ABC-type nickel/cobalt efflux system permease component RcnA